MEQWWVVFLFSFLCPVMQIVTGLWLKYFPPKFQNSVFGYYSARSASSPELWQLAQRSYGNKNLLYGVIALVLALTVSFMLPIGQLAANCINLVLGLTSLAVAYIQVEQKLKKQRFKTKK